MLLGAVQVYTALLSPALLLAFTVTGAEEPKQNSGLAGLKPEMAKSPNGQQFMAAMLTKLSVKSHSGSVLIGNVRGVVWLPSSFSTAKRVNGLGKGAMSSCTGISSFPPGKISVFVCMGPPIGEMGIAVPVKGLPA